MTAPAAGSPDDAAIASRVARRIRAPTRFGGALDRVVFAIHDRRAGHPALDPFEARV